MPLGNSRSGFFQIFPGWHLGAAYVYRHTLRFIRRVRRCIPAGRCRLYAAHENVRLRSPHDAKFLTRCAGCANRFAGFLRCVAAWRTDSFCKLFSCRHCGPLPPVISSAEENLKQLWNSLKTAFNEKNKNTEALVFLSVMVIHAAAVCCAEARFSGFAGCLGDQPRCQHMPRNSHFFAMFRKSVNSLWSASVFGHFERSSGTIRIAREQWIYFRSKKLKISQKSPCQKCLMYGFICNPLSPHPPEIPQFTALESPLFSSSDFAVGTRHFHS